MAEFTSHEAAAHEAAALPVLPPARLIGREAVLASVYAQLKESKPVLVHGGAGVGKTALAATLANAYAQQPGGVLWFNINRDPLDALLARVGRAYEISELMTADNPVALLGAAASTLTQHKPLVVLDGQHDPQATARFVTRCADRLAVLLLNSEVIEGPWASIALTPLDGTQSVALFKQEANIQTAETDADLRELVQPLGGLPFALSVAGRALLANKQTPATYKGVLAQVAAATGGDPATTALTASFTPLNGALQGVVLIMGATLTGAASAELLSMIGGAPVESVQQAMNVLAGLKLAERSQRYGLPYYRLHEITHTFAQERLRSSERLAGLQDKIRDTVLAYAQKYSSESDAHYDKLATEMDNILATARWSAQHGQRDVANQLIVSLTQAGDFITERGYVYELLQLRSVGISSSTAFPAYQQDEPEAQAASLFSMLDSIDEDIDEAFEDTGNEDIDFGDESEEFSAYGEEAGDFDEGDTDNELALDLALDDLDDTDEDAPGEVTEAIATLGDDLTALRAALLRARQDGDMQRQVTLLRAMGRIQVEQSQHTEAILTYNEVLNAQEALNDQPGALETLEMLAALMQKTENLQAAVFNATRGIKLAETLGDVETRMQLLITLGDARQQLGESADAARAYGQALEIARNRDDTQHEAIVLYKLGAAQLDSGDAATAAETLEQALSMFRAQNRREYEGRVLGALGSAYGEMERWAEAINFHMSALYIAREVKDSEEEALQLSSLGYASIQAGQLGQAVLRYRQALHLAYQTSNRANIVSTLVDLVRLLLHSPRHLSVCELLTEEALRYDPNNKDARQFHERVMQEKMAAEASGTPFVPVNGSAQDYAYNAYKLLDE